MEMIFVFTTVVLFFSVFFGAVEKLNRSTGRDHAREQAHSAPKLANLA